MKKMNILKEIYTNILY